MYHFVMDELLEIHLARYVSEAKSAMVCCFSEEDIKTLTEVAKTAKEYCNELADDQKVVVSILEQKRLADELSIITLKARLSVVSILDYLLLADELNIATLKAINNQFIRD